MFFTLVPAFTGFGAPFTGKSFNHYYRISILQFVSVAVENFIFCTYFCRIKLMETLAANQKIVLFVGKFAATFWARHQFAHFLIFAKVFILKS
jgi:hypothetical protein